MSIIHTYSGRTFDLLNPRAEDVVLEDIAHALSNLSRFTGHTARHYSVAEHSVRCLLAAQQLGANPLEQLEVLMHDATEAYTGDVASPLKRLLPSYKRIETEVRLAVAERFGLAAEEPSYVKEIDLGMLLEERDALHRVVDISSWPAAREEHIRRACFAYRPTAALEPPYTWERIFRTNVLHLLDELT